MKISSTWNGESVEKELSEVFGRAGRPIAIVKDQGSDLSKGVRLYEEREGTGRLQVVDDVGHVTANALKAEFSSSTEFKSFLEAVTAGSAKIRQTELASLLPPKIRSKGRFQGITKLAKWAGEILGLASNADSTKGDGRLAKLRTAFSGLLGLQSFIARFVEIGSVCEDFLRCMKQDGLNADSYKSAKTILARLPPDSKVAMRLVDWLDKHMETHKLLGLGQQRLLVSDDVIESLFGYFKVVVQRSPRAELNRLVYMIPALCGTHSHGQIDQAVRALSHSEMAKYIAEKLPPTLRQQREEVLDALQAAVQEPGKSLLCGGP